MPHPGSNVLIGGLKTGRKRLFIRRVRARRRHGHASGPRRERRAFAWSLWLGGALGAGGGTPRRRGCVAPTGRPLGGTRRPPAVSCGAARARPAPAHSRAPAPPAFRRRRYLQESGSLVEMEPVCVLDFYVHEACQRSGVGRRLLEVGAGAGAWRGAAAPAWGHGLAVVRAR